MFKDDMKFEIRLARKAYAKRHAMFHFFVNRNYPQLIQIGWYNGREYYIWAIVSIISHESIHRAITRVEGWDASWHFDKVAPVYFGVDMNDEPHVETRSLKPMYKDGVTSIAAPCCCPMTDELYL